MPRARGKLESELKNSVKKMSVSIVQMSSRYFLDGQQANIIKTVAGERRLTRKAIAETLGVDRSTLYRQLDGRARTTQALRNYLFELLGKDSRVAFLGNGSNKTTGQAQDLLPVAYSEFQRIYAELQPQERLRMLGDVATMLKKYERAE